MADAGVGSAAHSLDRARAALQEARARAEHSPSGPNLKALEEARAHMDYCLETLPRPPAPQAINPSGVPVSCPGGLALCGVPCGCQGRNPSHYKESECQPGEQGSEDV